MAYNNHSQPFNPNQNNPNQVQPQNYLNQTSLYQTNNFQHAHAAQPNHQTNPMGLNDQMYAQYLPNCNTIGNRNSLCGPNSGQEADLFAAAARDQLSHFLAQSILYAHNQNSYFGAYNQPNSTINNTINANHANNLRNRYDSTMSINHANNYQNGHAQSYAQQQHLRQYNNQREQQLQEQHQKEQILRDQRLQNEQRENLLSEQGQIRVQGGTVSTGQVQNGTVYFDSHRGHGLNTQRSSISGQNSQIGSQNSKNDFRQRIGSDQSGSSRSGFTSISRVPVNPLSVPSPQGNVKNQIISDIESNAHSLVERQPSRTKVKDGDINRDRDKNLKSLNPEQEKIINHLVKQQRKRSGQISANKSINKSSSFAKKKSNFTRKNSKNYSHTPAKRQKSFKNFNSRGDERNFTRRKSRKSLGPRFYNAKFEQKMTLLQRRRSVQLNNCKDEWKDVKSYDEDGASGVGSGLGSGTGTGTGTSEISESKPRLVTHHPATCETYSNIPAHQFLGQKRFQSSCNQLNLLSQASRDKDPDHLPPTPFIRQSSVSADTGTGTISQGVSRNSSQENFIYSGSTYQPAPTVHNLLTKTENSTVEKNIHNVPDNCVAKIENLPKSGLNQVKDRDRESVIKKNVSHSNIKPIGAPQPLQANQYYNEPSCNYGSGQNNHCNTQMSINPNPSLSIAEYNGNASIHCLADFVTYSQMAHTTVEEGIAKQINIKEEIATNRVQNSNQNQNSQITQNNTNQNSVTDEPSLSPIKKVQKSSHNCTKPIENSIKIEAEQNDDNDDDYSTEEEYEISTRVGSDGVKRTYKQPTKKSIYEALDKSVHQASILLSKSRTQVNPKKSKKRTDSSSSDDSHGYSRLVSKNFDEEIQKSKKNSMQAKMLGGISEVLKTFGSHLDPDTAASILEGVKLNMQGVKTQIHHNHYDHNKITNDSNHNPDQSKSQTNTFKNPYLKDESSFLVNRHLNHQNSNFSSSFKKPNNNLRCASQSKLRRKLSYNLLGTTHEEGTGLEEQQNGMSQIGQSVQAPGPTTHQTHHNQNSHYTASQNQNYQNQNTHHHRSCQITPYHYNSINPNHEGRLQNGEIIDNKNDRTQLIGTNLASSLKPVSTGQINNNNLFDKDNPHFISQTSVLGPFNPKFQSTLLNNGNVLTNSRFHHNSGGSAISTNEYGESYCVKSMAFLDHKDEEERHDQQNSSHSNNSSQAKMNTSGISATSTPKPDNTTFNTRMKKINHNSHQVTHNFTKAGLGRSTWSEATDVSSCWVKSSPMGAKQELGDELENEELQEQNGQATTCTQTKDVGPTLKPLNLTNKLSNLHFNSSTNTHNKESNASHEHETKSLEKSSKTSKHSKSRESNSRKREIEANSQTNSITNSLEGTISNGQSNSKNSPVANEREDNLNRRGKKSRRSILQKTIGAAAAFTTQIKMSGNKRPSRRRSQKDD